MKIYTDIEQGTQQWFDIRLGKFTASHAQAIATNGKGLETLVYDKVAEILTRKMKESYTNSDIERGKELEEMARNTYELETGIAVTRVGFIEKSERVGCSPDGLIGEDGLQEIKCINDANFVKYMHLRDIDKDHIWQMQMQMDVTGRKWCDYVVYNPNFPKPLIITRIERDNSAIERIRLGCEAGIQKVDEILGGIK
jgi:predicted phage-related endonuclease